MTGAWTTMLAQGGIFRLAHEAQFGREAATEHGRESDAVYMGIFWISVVAFVVLMALMVVFALKYRRRPGIAPPRSPSHNTPLELVWTIVPTIALVWMFFAGFWGFAKAVVAPAGALELFLEAKQWQWTVTYPNGAVTGALQTSPKVSVGDTWDVTRNPKAPHAHLGSKEVPIIVVPAGRPVLFRMISIDVIHAFWVPDFRGKLDVVPNRYTNYWFEADESRIGDHYVFCAEYCGQDHSEMLAVLRVLPADEYQAVIDEWATPKSPVEFGRLTWRNNCSSCHSIDGSKNTGPTWQNMWGYPVEIGQGPAQAGVVDENYVRRSILDPGYQVVAGYKNQMQSFTGRLSEAQINALIVFMRSLSDRGGPPPDPGAGGEQPAKGATPAGGH